MGPASPGRDAPTTPRHTASANQSAPAYCPPPKEFRLLLARFLSEIALLSCLFSAWPDACFSKPKGWSLEYFQGVNRLCASSSANWRSWCRSEEHTSELQSLMRISYAVFCLKKKKRFITCI